MNSSRLLLEPETQKAVEHFIAAPGHAVLLYGPENIGKHALAIQVAAQLVGVELDALARVPGYREITAEKSVITIDQIRELAAFFSRKTVGDNAIKRVVVIVDAERMQLPAQNALLKLLEEPPADTVLLLTSSAPHKLLPTIMSRLQRIQVQKPSAETIRQYFSKHSAAEIAQAMLLGEGRIGLVQKYLEETDETDGVSITDVRTVLGMGLYEQLLYIESSLKDKNTALEFVQLLAKLSAASLRKVADTSGSTLQWQRISSASYTALEALSKNANAKLVLTELMLALRS